MSAELIGILGVRVSILAVGVALARLILAGKRDTDRQLGGMDIWLASIGERVTCVEGLLEGLTPSGRAGSPGADAGR